MSSFLFEVPKYTPSLIAFDFDLPGVTSMSVDTHKFGYTLKGSSVVLYRSPELRRCQYFCYPKWEGGLYSTPAIAGSRTSGLIAQCWASMVNIGEEGYLKNTRDIMECCRTISAGVNRIEGLKALDPEAMIVCFFSTRPDLQIYAIGDMMSKKGWSLSLLQFPPGAHITCTLKTVGHENEFLNDLERCVHSLLTSGMGKVGGQASMYGAAVQMPAGMSSIFPSQSTPIFAYKS
jgi:sphinganine-1-phosphate aldolase